MGELLPGRSLDAIRKRASRDLGVTNTMYRLWTPEEDALLKEYYPDGKENLLRLLPKRSWEAIMQHSKKLKKDKDD